MQIAPNVAPIALLIENLCLPYDAFSRRKADKGLEALGMSCDPVHELLDEQLAGEASGIDQILQDMRRLVVKWRVHDEF